MFYTACCITPYILFLIIPFTITICAPTLGRTIIGHSINPMILSLENCHISTPLHTPYQLRREVRTQVNGNRGPIGIQHTVNMSSYASAVSNLNIAESPAPSVRYVGRGNLEDAFAFRIYNNYFSVNLFYSETLYARRKYLVEVAG